MKLFEQEAEAEAKKYAAQWQDPRYRIVAHGVDLWRNRREIFPIRVDTALDVGCGHGRLMAHWLKGGIDAYGVDIVDVLDPEIREHFGGRLIVTPLWDLEVKEKFDLGVAADVLEHLPQETVDASLEAIARSCHLFVTQTAEFKSSFGQGSLHLTIKPAGWWRERMLAIGGTVDQIPYATPPTARKHILRWQP